MTHTNHLQQLLPHHQAPQPPPTPPSVQPPPPTPLQSPPDQPTSQVATSSPQTPHPSFNPEEMPNQMKTTLQESLATVVEITQDRQPQHLSRSPPPLPAPAHPDSHRHLSSSHIQNQSHSSRRSRSLRRPKEPAVIDRRPLSVPRSPRRHIRGRSAHTAIHHGTDLPQGHDSSVTLKSVSPDRRSLYYTTGIVKIIRLSAAPHSDSRPLTAFSTSFPTLP